MSAIIGTAGHIDHGKTALIRALTGIETDRLREEKERGISIDLGFAWIDLPDGARAGIVDVPGHERFIRNMLAGAHGIDLVLFVVAADDGVMPQSEEHLDIVHLLGVREGIVVLTKTDLVDPARIDEVREEIAILTLDTILEEAPVVPVSPVTGSGIAKLRDEIARRLPANKPDGTGAGRFRLPIDRAFVVHGHGVVVTGTATSGTVAPGDTLRILPGSDVFRVRTVQVHGTEVTSAGRGQRVALNLAGAERPEVRRGHVALDPGLTTMTERFDARVEIRPFARKPVPSRRRVRLHIGTTEVFARLVLLDGRKTLAPKEVAWAQLRCEEPVVARRGDRFVLRAEAADRTLGGGEVVHPFAPRHRERDGAVGPRLEAIFAGGASASVVALLELEREIFRPLDWLAQVFDLSTTTLRKVLSSEAIVTLPGAGPPQAVTTPERWERWRSGLLDALKCFHDANPLLPGMEMELLRSGLPGNVPAKLFRAIVDRVGREGTLVREQSLVRLPTHQATLAGEEEELSTKITKRLQAGGRRPPDAPEIASALGIEPRRANDLLHALERAGTVARVSGDLWYHTAVLEGIRADAASRIRDTGPIGAADFRDLLGVTRKYAIPLLEFLDRSGFTIRVGDQRKLRRDPR